MSLLTRWMMILMAIAWVTSDQTALAQGNRGGDQGGVQYGAGFDPQQMQQALQRISQQLQQGEKEFKVVGEKANEARLEWQKVDNEHKKNLREIREAKKLAEEEAKNDPALKAARAKTDELRNQLTEIRKQLAMQLTKDNANYQAALAERTKAAEESKANAGVDAGIRRSLARNVSEAEKKLRTIEEVVLADHSEAKRVNSELREALAEMAVIVKKNSEAAESDARVSSAKVAFQRTRDELKAATAVRSQAEGAANRVQAIMQALIRERSGIEAKQQFIQRTQAQPQGQNGNNRGPNNRGGRR